MVDFKKLRESKSKPKPIHPRDIFNSLPKPPGINDLYASQAEVLDGWFGRRTDRDVVIKLHTGGGKTLVALLMAQSVMNELGEPVIYLAPTNQPVDQVIAKSQEYGIPTVRYLRSQALASEFFDGKAALVGAYETLFNGRSKFGVRNSGQGVVKAGAIILDDAHVALSSVRDAFSLTIAAATHPEVYADLAGRFRTAFHEVGRSGSFADITSGKDYGVMEVPSWAWQRKLPEIESYLASQVDAIDAYVWPFLRDNLAVCHCLFSRRSVTVTPIFPPVDMLPTFEDCPRRVYMSATIADDSEIVRAFGASPAAVGKPVTSTSLAGVGERMILIPELMKLGGAPVAPMVKKTASYLAKHDRGAVILSPSGPAAEKWTDIATYPNSSTAVAAQVMAMQAGTTFGPIVLANRYDGIDLAGDACRFLVMDNLPQGTSDYDVYRMNVAADSAVSSLLAQRIEQGIGRGTRGGGDYCAVILIGARLVGWIGRKNNLAFLTASTRVQLAMGQEMSAAVTTVNEVGQTIMKCLNRDPDWVAYHASELTEAAHAAPVNTLALRIAGAERKVFRLQRLGHFEHALQLLDKLISDDEPKGDSQRRALGDGGAHRLPDERRTARSEAADPRLLNQQQSFAAQGTARLCATADPGQAIRGNRSSNDGLRPPRRDDRGLRRGRRREIVVLLVLHYRLARGSTFPTAARLANALIETSLPTVSLWWVNQFTTPAVAFGTWPTMLYFIFIVASTLRLDFVLPAFTGVVAAAGYLGVATWVLSFHGMVTNPNHVIKAALMVVAGAVAGLVAVRLRAKFRRAVEEAVSRERVTNLFGQHVSPAVVDRLLDNPSEFAGDIRVMFLDIRNFTENARDRPPEAVVEFLNSTFAFMIEAIDRHGGFINKFLGDGFLAIFGAPLDDPAASGHAVEAAREILAEIDERALSHGSWPLKVGIGLHLGSAVTGNVGSPRRKEFTAIGDTVNLVSRLEQLTKEYPARLIVSDSMMASLGATAGAARPLGKVAVRGYTEPVPIWGLD